MSFVKNMQNRYTTKKYDASKKIEVQKIAELKEIVRLSPSSINSQPWQFVFVSDPAIKEKLAPVSKHNTEKVLNCDTVVVFNRINIDNFERQLASNALTPIAIDYYNNVIKLKSDTEIKSWFEKQVYIALGVFLSACANMDIDTTAMEGIECDKYDEILGADGYQAIVAVAIGYRDKDDANQLHIKPKLRKDINQVIKSI